MAQQIGRRAHALAALRLKLRDPKALPVAAGHLDALLSGGETVLLCYGSEPIPEPLLGCTYIILCDGRPANVGLARGTILSPAGRGGDRELPTRDYATLRIRNGGIAIEEHR